MILAATHSHVKRRPEDYFFRFRNEKAPDLGAALEVVAFAVEHEHRSVFAT
jgi:hypothetical protein